jgi:hypothetical protein
VEGEAKGEVVSKVRAALWRHTQRARRFYRAWCGQAMASDQYSGAPRTKCGGGDRDPRGCRRSVQSTLAQLLMILVFVPTFSLWLPARLGLA